MGRASLIGAGALLLAVAAAPVAAQTPPPPGGLLSAPHPSMPWSLFNPNVGAWDYGTVIQYIPVPAQPVAISVRLDVPDGVPPQTEQRLVEIPGYYITETTTGFYYPERWTLQQLNVGTYQWLQLPAEFRRKAIVERRPPAKIP